MQTEILKSLHLCPTYSLLLIHRLLILQCNTWNRPSRLAACCWPTDLREKNTISLYVNPSSVNHKMVKHTQTIRWSLPTNCLSVFDHLAGLAHKGLSAEMYADVTQVSTSAIILLLFCTQRWTGF